MGKAEISISSHSKHEIEEIVSKFEFGRSTSNLELSLGNGTPQHTKVELQRYAKLFGGYSASNYKVEDGRGEVAVLKIMNGYDRSWVEGQTQLQNRLRQAGYNGICHCLPLRDDASGFVALTPKEGTPTCLLTFCEGSNASLMVEAGKVDRIKVLSGVGSGLARLHSVAINCSSECGPAPKLRTWREGGACLLASHVNGTALSKMQASDFTKRHAFVTEFYPPRAEELTRLMLASETADLDLPKGCLHGDPYLDNVLVHVEDGGTFSAFVDLEDITVGPLLFDIACCATGSCFDEKANLLDLPRLRSFLAGYTAVRKLTIEEKRHFVAFMRLALLVNCAWRFANFNIDNRRDELVEQREAFVELKQRIEELEIPDIAGKVNDILMSMAS